MVIWHISPQLALRHDFRRRGHELDALRSPTEVGTEYLATHLIFSKSFLAGFIITDFLRRIRGIRPIHRHVAESRYCHREPCDRMAAESAFGSLT